jgi:hypothetical protein
VTDQDALDMFEELPRRVQTALLSNVHSLRSRGYLRFTDYPLPVAEVIASSGLMTVRIHDSGGVAFFANEQTKTLRRHMRHLLELYGIEFD